VKSRISSAVSEQF